MSAIPIPLDTGEDIAVEPIYQRGVWAATPAIFDGARISETDFVITHVVTGRAATTTLLTSDQAIQLVRLLHEHYPTFLANAQWRQDDSGDCGIGRDITRWVAELTARKVSP